MSEAQFVWPEGQVKKKKKKYNLPYVHPDPVISESSKPSRSSTPVVSKQSARWQVSKELYQTESNYVDILNNILQVGCLCVS